MFGSGSAGAAAALAPQPCRTRGAQSARIVTACSPGAARRAGVTMDVASTRACQRLPLTAPRVGATHHVDDRCRCCCRAYAGGPSAPRRGCSSLFQRTNAHRIAARASARCRAQSLQRPSWCRAQHAAAASLGGTRSRSRARLGLVTAGPEAVRRYFNAAVACAATSAPRAAHARPGPSPCGVGPRRQLRAAGE